jgi:hypothetical protein
VKEEIFARCRKRVRKLEAQFADALDRWSCQGTCGERYVAAHPATCMISLRRVVSRFIMQQHTILVESAAGHKFTGNTI